jgi:hypothetical protein
MTEKMSNELLKDISKRTWGIAGNSTPTEEALMAAEILELRADAETSQNHNAGVIDRIVEQLREAGYTGTLSDMVDQACDARQFAENMSL